MYKQTIETFMKWIIGATFFVPLIFIPSSFIFPFIVPKIIIFRSLVLLLLGGYIALAAISWKEIKPKASPLNIVVGLFFLSFTISTFVGVDWYRSFWDNHERMLGLFTFFHYIVYYYIVSTVIRDKKTWRTLLRTFLVGGVLVMLAGVIQKYVNPEWLLNRGASRVSATLGNAIYFSGYGLFVLTLGYLLAVQEEKKSFWQRFAIVGGILGVLGVFMGGTRGALLGLIAGVGVYILLHILFGSTSKRVRIGFSAVLAVIILAIPTLFVFKNSAVVQNVDSIRRLVNIDFDALSQNTRVMAWGIAIESWKEYPVFGWGPNNYYFAFNKYYKPTFLEHGIGETWFDNAHSSVWNTLAVQGIVGLVLYLGLFIIPIRQLRRRYKEKEIDIHEMSIWVAFLTAHFVSMYFVFENPTSYMYFFFTLAYIEWRTMKPTENVSEKNDKVSAGLLATVCVVVLLFIYSTNINPARANMATLDVIRSIGIAAQGTNADPVALYHHANEIPTPHIDDNRNDFARNIISVSGHLANNGRGEDLKSYFMLSLEELEKNRALHPLDIRVHIVEAQIAQMAYQIFQDPQYLPFAKKVIDEAIVFSERRQQLYYLQSTTELMLGNREGAISLIEKALEDDKQIPESWWRLAVTHFELGDVEAAANTIFDATDFGIIFTSGQQSTLEVILNEAAARGLATTTTE